MNEEIYKSPEAELEVNNIESESDALASRVDRFLASFVDGLIIAPVWLGLVYFSEGFKYLTGEAAMPYSYGLIIALATTIIFVAINGRLMVKKGQTFGKKALKIKMVALSNETITIKHLLKRYSFYWGVPQIPLIGPFINMINILYIFSKSKRCLHDHVGGTKVIKLTRA
jgi:uncharacterized RDD family membrane protein YckC